MQHEEIGNKNSRDQYVLFMGLFDNHSCNTSKLAGNASEYGPRLRVNNRTSSCTST